MQNATRFQIKSFSRQNFQLKSGTVNGRTERQATSKRRRHDVDGKGAKPITALAVSAH